MVKALVDQKKADFSWSLLSRWPVTLVLPYVFYLNVSIHRYVYFQLMVETDLWITVFVIFCEGS